MATIMNKLTCTKHNQNPTKQQQQLETIKMKNKTEQHRKKVSKKKAASQINKPSPNWKKPITSRNKILKQWRKTTTKSMMMKRKWTLRRIHLVKMQVVKMQLKTRNRIVLAQMPLKHSRKLQINEEEETQRILLATKVNLKAKFHHHRPAKTMQATNLIPKPQATSNISKQTTTSWFNNKVLKMMLLLQINKKMLSNNLQAKINKSQLFKIPESKLNCPKQKLQ